MKSAKEQLGIERKKSYKILKEKRGRPRKIESFDLSLLKYFINSRNKKDSDTRTQQKMAVKYRKRGLDLHRSTISRTITREGQYYKKGEKQYAELNIEKVKQFVLDNY